jgi:hypothetical protein
VVNTIRELCPVDSAALGLGSSSAFAQISVYIRSALYAIKTATFRAATQMAT